MPDAAFVSGGDFTRDKRSSLVPGAVINRDKRSFFYLSLALDFKTGTKDFICPGFKHNRDKCVGSKPCSVVVDVRKD